MKTGMVLVVLLLSFVLAIGGYPAACASQSSTADTAGGNLPAENIPSDEDPRGTGDSRTQWESVQREEAPFEPFEDDWGENGEDEFEAFEEINDPLQPFNRAMFRFNDKLYYYALKPVARGYRFIVPRKARISVLKFFSNAATPVRLVNCILQARVKGTGIEISRFAVNTTVGLAGFFDPAHALFNLSEQKADFDQTLGTYRMKPVLYIHWPILGASSLRGTLGIIGDTACEPSTYLLSTFVKLGIAAYEKINETSLTIGDYEGLTEPALDPYIAIRDAYYQNRKSLVDSRK